MITNEEIIQGKSRLDEAELQLVHAYFKEIDERYVQLNPIQKRGFLCRLETLIGGMMVVRKEEDELFDYSTARKVREESGLNLTELSRQLKINKSTLSRIENGRARINLEFPYAKKYVEFLKQHGYDPFASKPVEVKE